MERLLVFDFGKVGFQYTVEEDNGLYSYIKGTLNLPKTVVAVAYVAWSYIVSVTSFMIPTGATAAVITSILNLFK